MPHCELIPGFIISALSVFCGCGENKMMMDTTMKGELKGDVAGTFKLDGPVQIQMQMQGPTVKYEGTFISEKLLDRVKVGETRSDWLVAVLGEPNFKTALTNGDEIWRWTYRPMEQTSSVLSVFGSSKDEPTLQPSTSFIRISGLTVVEKWRD